MAEMTFWEHVEELRWGACRVRGVWVLLAIGYFIAMPYLFDAVILAPCHNDFIFYELLRRVVLYFGVESDFINQDFEVSLININLAAPFFIHISTAFTLSIITAIPYLFYEIWRFVSPALLPRENRGIKGVFLFGTVMFFLGVALGYFMVYPLALRFLSGYQISTQIDNVLSLNSYIDNFATLIICMGIAFEFPLILWLLSFMGIITRRMLKAYRRHAVVVVVVIAAVITPTGDPFTLTLVALPLYLLYELSILLVKDKSNE